MTSNGASGSSDKKAFVSSPTYEAILLTVSTIVDSDTFCAGTCTGDGGLKVRAERGVDTRDWMASFSFSMALARNAFLRLSTPKLDGIISTLRVLIDSSLAYRERGADSSPPVTGVWLPERAAWKGRDVLCNKY